MAQGSERRGGAGHRCLKHETRHRQQVTGFRFLSLGLKGTGLTSVPSSTPYTNSGGFFNGSLPGGPLDADDLKLLAPLSREIAEAAYLSQVDSTTGAQVAGRNGAGDYSGIVFPNILPGASQPREYVLRRRHPDLKYDKNGKAREDAKYLSPPGRRNLLYFVPGTPPAWLTDPEIPILIAEGLKKTLAALLIAWHGLPATAEKPRLLPVGVLGAWNWRGTVGRAAGPNGARRNVKGPIPDLDLLLWKDRKAIISYDADTATKPSVLAARSALFHELTGRSARVGIHEWPLDQGKGLDDHIAQVGVDSVWAELERVSFGDWRERLMRNDKGKLIRCFDNLMLFLEHDPAWRNVLAFNAFSNAHLVIDTPPAPVTAAIGDELTDAFDIESIRWFERHGLLVSPGMVHGAMDAHARRNSFHPVREYLSGLVWDDRSRLDTWLSVYLGARADARYLAAVGRMFLISAVARIYAPGCQADHLLVLEGPQGICKSSAVRILAGEWFTDQIREFGTKDAGLQLRGIWIVELSELAALTNTRAEAERIKAFLTQRDEHLRVPYGRWPVRFPRSCVFIGTTNQTEYLKDESGGRRFWPVACQPVIAGEWVDLKGLKRDRDQLWAEAVARYHNRESWHITDENTIGPKVAIQSKRVRDLAQRSPEY
jgi:hypothetical protein